MNKPKALLPLDYLNSILRYEPENGKFYWAYLPKTSKKLIGQEAGTVDNLGYLIITIKRKRYKSHRLAWLMFYGQEPNGMIDHINRNKTDNRIANLRCVTNSENMQNKGVMKNNSTGFRGVYWHKRIKKFVASYGLNKKLVHLGYFDTAIEAGKVAEDARKIFFISS